MELSDYIMKFGRVVAYHPELRNIKDENGNTTTTVSVLLLCQLLYWTKKGKGKNQDWIRKTSDEIQTETGLSYNEQRTARKNLVEELKLVEEHYRRSVHEMHFKVNIERLNGLWREYGNEINFEEKQQEKTQEKTKYDETYERLIKHQGEESPIKKRPLSEMIGLMVNSPEAKRVKRKSEIKKEIEKRLNIVADNSRWVSFFDFVVSREEKYNESLTIFLNWLLTEQSYDPIYYPPRRLKEIWPQAYSRRAEYTRKTPIIKPLPEEKDENAYVDMPKDIREKYHN